MDQGGAPRPNEPPSVVAAVVYADGRKVGATLIGDAGAWASKPGHVVWIGLHEPSNEILDEVQAQFGLPALAIEDARNAHQRPKLEEYGDALFIVARTAQVVDTRIAFGETHLFIGAGYVVNVRHGASTSYSTVRERCEQRPGGLSKGEDYILHAILDFIVDNYQPVIETLREHVEQIEDIVLSGALTSADIERLYLLRRDLLRLRNAVVPLVEVCRKLERADVHQIHPEMRPLFRDITDHVRMVQEEIDSLREVLAFAFEASQMAGQAQQNAITRRLAAGAAILAVPTAIAGIYGMNFRYMPELEWRYGYFAVLFVVIALCVGLYAGFRKSGWL